MAMSWKFQWFPWIFRPHKCHYVLWMVQPPSGLGLTFSNTWLRGLLASLGRLQHVILAKDSRGAQLTQAMMEGIFIVDFPVENGDFP